MEQTVNHIEKTQQTVLDEARKVNEERLKSVEKLASIIAEKIELEEQQKDNARRERQAIKAAEKAGWTQAQIKRFMKPPRPTPKLHKTTPSSMSQSPSQDAADQPPTTQVSAPIQA